MTLNAKKVRTSDIQAAYDVVVADLTNNPEALAADMTPAQSATALIEKGLKDINHQMRANAGRILESHVAAITNGKRDAKTLEDLSEEAKGLAELCLGKTLTTRKATATPADAASADTDASADQPSTPATSRAQVPAGKADTINALVKAITGQDIKLESLLATQAMLETALAKANATLESLKAGDDPKSVEKVPVMTKSGMGELETNNPMVSALNDQIAANVDPDITWEGLIASIKGAEDALKEAGKTELTLRRKVNSTKTPQRASTPSTPTATQEEITVDIVMQPGKDLFPSAYGAPATLLSFDVPTMDIDDPDVPEVDPTYKFYVPVLTEALHAIAEREIIWLYGDSGCGKSEFWKQIAARMGMPFTRLNMDGHLTRSDIIGVNRMVPNEDRQMEMRFIDGILPRAMAKPGLLLIDELDLGDPEIMAVLQPVLEGEPLRILEDHGRVVRPHPNFYIAITGNTTGLGSATNAYVNVYEQSAATRDRVSAYVEMPYMTPEIEKAVISERMPGIPDSFLEKLIQLANTVRTGYRQGDVNQIFSTRSTLAAARRYRRFSALYNTEEEAIHAILETVILNRMDETSRNAVKGYVDQIFAS